MGYGNRIRTKYTAKWGVQIAEMIFQTRSGACLHHNYAVSAQAAQYLALQQNCDIRKSSGLYGLHAHPV